MPFVLNPSAPLDVIAPHAIVLAPNASAPLEVIAPQPSVPTLLMFLEASIITPLIVFVVYGAVIAPQDNVPMLDTLPVDPNVTVFRVVTPVNAPDVMATPPTVALLIVVTLVMLPPMFKVDPFHVRPEFAFKCTVSLDVVTS